MNNKWGGIKVHDIPKRHIFLYEYVPRGSRVLIYGLGKLGDSYIQQIEALGYCEIVNISDIDSNKGKEYDYQFIELKDITVSDTIDFYVIAIDDIYIASKIYWDFVDRGIDNKKIINVLSRSNDFPKEKDIVENCDEKKDSEHLLIAIVISGGIGDNIITLSFCRRLFSIEKRIVIDIYTQQSSMEAIFGQEQYVRKIQTSKDVKRREYDVVFNVRQLVKIDYIDKERVSFFSADLLSRIQKTDIQRKKEIEIDTGKNDLNILDRAKLLGRNRYQMLGDGDIWNLDETMSKLSLNELFKSNYDSLKLDKYITIHAGAAFVDKNVHQTKEWSEHNYDYVVDALRKLCLGYKIIQIGDSQSYKIKNIDLYLENQHLELIKYVLSGAKLHIDIEGGMVHMATQLGTKCIVLFGPTPVKYYGYKNNVNICKGNCLGCMGITQDWNINCPLHTKPKCMNSITPEMVFKEIEKLM